MSYGLKIESLIEREREREKIVKKLTNRYVIFYTVRAVTPSLV
jgi:hypothetical protein